MFRPLALIAALSLVASAPAYAETMKVSLTGKDAATIHADISPAASLVCAKAIADNRQIADIASCAAAAEATAMASPAVASMAAANTVQVASR